eukprot:6185038-Pleurochrysis_carterae.AAC.1
MSISDCAKNDIYKRYDTGEPHPLDGCRTRIVGYVDPITRWQMYRLDEDAVQPESGSKERAYYDPEKAKLQRDRWVEKAKEDLSEIECNREHYANELFPEPPPTHPDDEEPWRYSLPDLSVCLGRA